MPPRYPLITLSRLRAEQVKGAAATCRAQHVHVEEAKGALAQAELATRAQVDTVAQTHEHERARLERGELRAGDLVRTGAWAHVATLAAATLRKAEGARRLDHQRAEEAFDAARRVLASRKSEADAVTKHAERWSLTLAKQNEDAQADEVEDRWRSR